MLKVTEQLFRSPTGVLSQPEVAAALGGTDFSRHGMIKRALAKGEVLGVRRGLYCLAPRFQKRPVSVFALAQRVYGPSYVSLETALAFHGWIPEAVHACTCVSLRKAKEYRTPLGVFSYRRVPQETLYTDVARSEDPDGNVFFMASPIKALADYVYVHGEEWCIGEACASLRIEPDDWASAAQEQLDMLATNYSNGRVRRFLASWKEALLP